MDANQIKLILHEIFMIETENIKINKKIKFCFCSKRKIKEFELTKKNNNNKQRELESIIYEQVDEVRCNFLIKFIETSKSKIKYFEDAYEYGYIKYSMYNCLHYSKRYKTKLHTFEDFFANVMKLLDKKEFEKIWTKTMKYSGRISNSLQTLKYQKKLEDFISTLPNKPITKVEKAKQYIYEDDGIYRPWEDDKYDDSYNAWLAKGGPNNDVESYDGAFDPYDGGDFI